MKNVFYSRLYLLTFLIIFFSAISADANWQKKVINNSITSTEITSQNSEQINKNDSLPAGVTQDWLNTLTDGNGNKIVTGNETSRNYEDPEGDAVQRKIFNGLEAGSLYGLSISSAGDVNNDGYDDIIIGAAGYSSGKGRAYIYFGSLNMNTTPDVILTGETSNSSFGISVSKAGDVNGDGYSDVIVGARFYSSSTGRAYIFYGGAVMNNIADITITGETINSLFGRSVSSAGDVNGDGYSDVIVGAYGYSSSKGRAYVYFGGVSMNNIADVILNGETNLDYFGYYVSNAGDINADGYSDIIIGAYGYMSEKGKTYVFLGGASMNSVADLTMTGEAANNFFGRSVSSAGDLNGDGYSDVIVGAYGFSAYTGRAYIFYGGFILDNNPDLVLTGAVAGNSFGVSVSIAGDVNGDGYSDVIVGSSGFSSSTGAAYLFFGGLSMDSYADVTVVGEQELSYFGNSVSPAGDVNGDGYSDVIVGAFGYSSNTGIVYLYDYYMRNEIIHDFTLTGETTNDNFGCSISSAGDVNGDGYSDIIVGANNNNAGGSNAGRAYIYLGGTSINNTADIIMTGEVLGDDFGISVSSAGDVNGDGYSDVIVGGEENIYIFLGSENMNNLADVIITRGNNNNFGNPVSSAGDVNGDGYSDVIIGETSYNNNAGKAEIYFGGSSMNNVPDVTMSVTGISFFGRSVSSAGDVNGDGYSDVIVGASDSINVLYWAAYIFYGGSSMDNYQDVIMTSECDPFSPMDMFSVSTAGDVNGDGFSDVIVGESHLADASGHLFIFYGGLTMDNVADVEKSENFPFASSVSSAGDLNGDGYSDVIVGAVNIGYPNPNVFIYYGGTSMNNVADVIITSEFGNWYFGMSATTIDDINGDGYSDLILGAPFSNTANIYLGSTISTKPNLIYAKDVPNDQGGKIKLKWAKSGFDIPGNNVITDYIVYISDPPGIEGFQWIQAADILATKFPFYYYIANTLNDSSSISNGNNFFLIKARNANTGEFWSSNIISGRSIDNIAPPIVSPFTAIPLSNNVSLNWKKNDAPDLKNYILFRSTSPTIDPESEPIFTTTTDSTYIDTSPLTGNYYYFIVAQDIHNNKSPESVTERPNITLNLTMFIEGFYNDVSNSQVSDTISVELRNSISPFSVIDHAEGVVAVDGTVQLKFASASDGNYYFAVRHRNSIETWNTNPIAFSNSTPTNYNLSSSLSQAFGSNQLQVDDSPLRFAIYSGDVNQDGIVDVADASQIDNDAFIFAGGYLSSDVNGDGIVDVADAVFADNNAFNFVGKVTP